MSSSWSDSHASLNPTIGAHPVASQLGDLVRQGKLDDDKAQMKIAQDLDELLQNLSLWRPKKGFFRRKTSPPKGLYIWGRVGRGKSMLMDWFFENVPAKLKRRVHFHAFMLEVHRRIALWRALSASERRRDPNFVRGAGDDPIAPVARSIASEARVLCFDEFHVTNIADAMILSRLFTALWVQEEIIVVATSNRAPQALYENGLNRALFEPFIALIPQHMKILELPGKTDHRLRQLTAAPVYYEPLGKKSDEAIEAAWRRLTGEAATHPANLSVQGRTLTIEQSAAGVARIEFVRLCGQPLGAADYLALARAFQTVILEHVPVMGPDSRNEAQRFTWLIDALYETRTKLVMSAEKAPDKLYTQGDGSFEFARTASRLMEMRSAEYLAARRNLDIASGEGTG